jgi:5-(carboxyamino)imidazole ribonucleotide synthase
VPHATVGIVGAGQLARMSYEAATRLDVHLRVLARDEAEAAARVFSDVVIGSPDDAGDLEAFSRICDVVTFDHELVDVDVLARLESQGHVIRPSAATLAIATDKRQQRETFARAGIPVPTHEPVHAPSDAVTVAETHGWPVVVKAASRGYDGRGVWTLASADEAAAVVTDAHQAGLDLFAEPHLQLEHELAVIVARRASGNMVVYPVVETIQVEGICHEVLVPARVDEGLAADAAKLGVEVAETIASVGLLAIEMFVVDGQILLNEVAARPHNSGHFSIDGAQTSQFENHLRSVLDLPLGEPALLAPAVAMCNVIGTDATGDPHERLATALEVPGAHVHLYGKTPRRGRKIGHVTAVGDDLDEVRGRARQSAEILAGGRMGGPR